MPGLNHVTGRCWEHDTRIPSWITSFAANRSHCKLIASESTRSAAPSRRAGRNTSCAEFEAIIASGVDNLSFPRLVPSSNARPLAYSLDRRVFLFFSLFFFSINAALCRSFTAEPAGASVSPSKNGSPSALLDRVKILTCDIIVIYNITF